MCRVYAYEARRGEGEQWRADRGNVEHAWAHLDQLIRHLAVYHLGQPATLQGGAGKRNTFSVSACRDTSPQHAKSEAVSGWGWTQVSVGSSLTPVKLAL